MDSAPDDATASPIDKLLHGEIALLDEVSSNTARQSRSAPLAPDEIASLEALLQGAEDRDTIIELGLRLASVFAPTVGLFIVRDALPVGHCAVADGVASRLDTILLPATTQSIFTRPAIANQAFRGRRLRTLDSESQAIALLHQVSEGALETQHTVVHERETEDRSQRAEHSSFEELDGPLLGKKCVHELSIGFWKEQ